MNFFEQQNLARRNTRRLIILLGLAVISLITVTTLLLAGMFAYFQGNSTEHLSETGHPGLWQALLNALSWELIAFVSVLIGTVVILGSLFKLMQLRSGGRAIAEAMGGRLLNTNTQNADERKILNVVEEMAIASGTPVPPVYLIEEEGINAFAAGHNLQNAVIGITRGCIHLLSRDELQGVVAHEFSHILHGDMRINLRLIALLHGILLLGLIGEYMLRSTRYRTSSSNKDNSVAIALGVGLGLIIIGYAGTFFGNIIKAAVSRQREFLADASAVQFTRNPDGIAGALKKIGGHINGSRLELNNAAEFSHMYFSEGVTTAFSQLMATHPPLPERIRRIEPRWDGKYPKVEISLAEAAARTTSSDTAAVSGFTATPIPATAAVIAESLEHLGQPTATHIEYAHQKLTALGPDIRSAAHDSFSARALMFGLFLDRHPDARAQQWQLLGDRLGQTTLPSIKKVAQPVLALDASLRLPLIELALPALKELSQDQCEEFKHCLELLINADKKVSLMEWSLRRVILHHLPPTPPPRLHQRNLRELRSQCQILISILAYAGAKSQDDAQTAFRAAAESLRFSALELLPKTDCKLSILETALVELNELKPLQKPQLLKAMGQCIGHDGEITVNEAELFRAMADALDCPVPPLIVSRNQNGG